MTHEFALFLPFVSFIGYAFEVTHLFNLEKWGWFGHTVLLGQITQVLVKLYHETLELDYATLIWFFHENLVELTYS